MTGAQIPDRSICPSCWAQSGLGTEFCVGCGQQRPSSGWLSDPLLQSTVAGRFFIRGIVGRGGFGSVYEATHETLGGRRAVKVLRADLSANPELHQRFRREAEILYRLSAPQIVKVEEFGFLDDGRPFMVMEYVEGERLDKLICPNESLSVLRCIRISRQILYALADAHEAGILHRDLKAENIIVGQQPRFGERVKVLDLGISFIVGMTQRLTRDTRTVGTPEYMAPEQWRGDSEIDGRADLFALGVLMYEMLVGRVPFSRSQGPGSLYSRLMKERPLPASHHRGDLPPGLDGFVLRLMSRERDRRPATAVEALKELEGIRERMKTGPVTGKAEKPGHTG